MHIADEHDNDVCTAKLSSERIKIEMHQAHTHTHTPAGVCVFLCVFFSDRAPGIEPAPPLESPGMHGAGMWATVGHTSMQCVSCCRVDGSEGRSCGALAASVLMASSARWAAPPAGQNNQTHGLQQ